MSKKEKVVAEEKEKYIPAKPALFSLRKGPIRPYVHTDETQLHHWLKLSLNERFQLILAVCLGCFIRFVNVGSPNKVLLEESKLVSIVNSYITGELFVDYNPPFVGLLFRAISQFLGYGDSAIEFSGVGSAYTFFPYYTLRGCSAIAGGATVFCIYRTLRCSGVNHLVALFGSYLFILENSFITQSRLIFVDAIYIFFFSLFISLHKTVSFRDRLGVSWLVNLLASAAALGLTVSSHWSGIFVFIYAIFSLTMSLYTLSGDIEIPAKTLRASFTIKYFCYFTIPLTIYLSLFKIHFDLLDKRGADYNILSSDFQAALQNNHIDNCVSKVGYGSQVMIRHYKSGEYLHSHDDTYRSSGHQQITMLDSFDDSSNFFEILPTRGNQEKLTENVSLISSPWKVRLRHIVTDSNIVVDPNHKPPLSEQEYNFQVTTDKDFEEEDDANNRVVLQLKVSQKYSRTEESKRNLRAIDTVFQIYNEKNQCYLLGTPLVLHEGFAEGQQEVICIKEPSYEASLWYIDWNKNRKHTPNQELVKLSEFTFLDKFLEIHLYNIKKLFIGDVGYDTGYGTSIGDWIFLRKGFTHWIDSDNHQVIYLLGNYITYLLVIISLGIFGCSYLYEIATFNPYKQIKTFDPSTYKYKSQSFDYALGYFITLVAMMFIKIELHLFNYLPSLLMGILLVAQTVQWGFDKVPKLTSVAVIVASIFVLLAYRKFSPIIYGLEWSQADCLKMMVSPGWDNAICSAYKDKA